MKAFLLFLCVLFPALAAWAGPLALSTREGGLASFDPQAWQLLGQLAAPSLAGEIALEPSGRTAWLARPGSSRVVQVNLEDGRETGQALVFSEPPRSLAWVALTGQLAVLPENSPRVYLVNPSDTSATATVAIPQAGVSLAPGPDTGTLAVMLADPDRLCLVDARQAAVVRTLALPYPAWALQFSRDGRWVAASHEVRGLVSLVDLQGRQLARRLEVGVSPRGLALSPDGSILWVAHQSGSTGVVSAIHVTTNAVAKSFRVVGETYGLAYLPASDHQPAGRLVVSAHVPEAEQTGMVYALDETLDRLLSNQPLDGTPVRIHVPPKAAPPAQSPTPTPAPSFSPTPGGPLPTATPIPRRSGNGLFRGGFHGRLLDQGQAIASTVGRVEAVNRRGRRYPGQLFDDGRFEIRKLPWGNYRLEFELEGYKPRTVPDQLLAFSGTRSLDVELEKKKDRPKP